MPRTVKLCPCGSGKSFETCCRDRKVVFSLEQARWRRAGQSCGAALDCTLTSLHLPGIRPGPDLYLGCLDQQLVDREDDFTIERCFEWFIFDYKLCGGKTVVETFRKRIFTILTATN